MPEAEVVEIEPGAVPDLAVDHHDLGRLTPEQIADLDRMNAPFGAEEPAKDLVDAADGEAGKVEPPSAKPATSFDEFTPPEDITPKIESVKDGGTQTTDKITEATTEFKSGSEIMPDAEIDKFRTERQKTNIRELRENYEKVISQFKGLQTKLSEIEKNGPDARVVDLERRNSELNAIVERKALEEHPYVQKTFTKPRQDALDFGRKALEMAKIDPGELNKAMSLQGEARVAALDELYASIDSPTIKGKVEKAVAVIEGTDDQKAAFFADREANFARMTEEQKAAEQRQVAEAEKNCRAAVDKAVDYLSKEKGFSFLAFSDKPGAEKWNEGLKSDINEATEFLLKNTDPMKLIALAVLGIRAPRMQVGYAALRGRLAEIESKSSERRASTPKITGGETSRNGAATYDPNEGLLGAAQRAIREVISQ